MVRLYFSVPGFGTTEHKVWPFSLVLILEPSQSFIKILFTAAKYGKDHYRKKHSDISFSNRSNVHNLMICIKTWSVVALWRLKTSHRIYAGTLIYIHRIKCKPTEKNWQCSRNHEFVATWWWAHGLDLKAYRRREQLYWPAMLDLCLTLNILYDLKTHHYG